MTKFPRALRVLLATLALSGALRAADAPPASGVASDAARTEAKAHYEEGALAYAQGRYRPAIDEFRQADRLAPSAPLSFNIARAYEKLGDASGALRFYRDYVRRAPNAANAAEVGALVARYEAELLKKGVQQLTVLSEPAGATVRLNGNPVGVTPWTDDLAPGRYRVELSLRGFADAGEELDLPAAHARDLSVALVREANEPGAVPPAGVAPAGAPNSERAQTEEVAAERNASAREFGILPWLLLGTGGAAFVGALSFEIARRNSESDAEGDPTQIGYKTKLDQMNGRQTAARVFAGVGGAFVLAGGALLAIDFLGDGSGRETRVGVAANPSGPYVLAAGSF